MPEGFASMAPNIRTDVVDFAAPGLDLSSGFIKPGKGDVRVEVVRCKAVISDLQSKEVKFRAVDPPEHNMYACFWKPPGPHPDGRAVDRRPIHMHAQAPPLALTLTLTLSLTRRESWRLIMSDPSDPKEEPTCLSLVRFNALAHLARHCDVGAAFLDAFRSSSAFHEGGGSTAEGQMRGSTATSAIRVNRVGGPFGGLRPGSDFHATRLLVPHSTLTLPLPLTLTLTQTLPLTLTLTLILALTPHQVRYPCGGPRAAPAAACGPRAQGVDRWR